MYVICAIISLTKFKRNEIYEDIKDFSDSWQYGAYAARKAFCEVIETISLSEKVIVCARYDDYDSARFMLPDRVKVIEMESDDSWARLTCRAFGPPATGGFLAF